MDRGLAPGAGTMSHMSAVRPFQAGDAPAATAIVRGLPDYFTEDVPGKVEHDAASHQAWVITNFDEMLDLLRYFGEDERVNAMRKAAPGDRSGIQAVRA